MEPSHLKKYFLFLIIYFIIDLIWLVGAKKLHQKVVEDVQKSPLVLNPIAGSLFYIIAPFAYLFFVQTESKNVKEAAENGAKIGFLMYGTFDITNKAIFNSYPWSYTMLDTLWGTFCMSLTSAIVFSIT